VLDRKIDDTSWRQLQREIGKAPQAYKPPAACHIFVYTLLRANIQIIVVPMATYVHLKSRAGTDTSGGMKSEIVITFNRMEEEVVIHADHDFNFILPSERRLNLKNFCKWLFDLACQLAESAPSR